MIKMLCWSQLKHLLFWVLIYTYEKRMPCFALNIDERKHINLKLVLVEMNIIRKYGDRKSVV